MKPLHVHRVTEHLELIFGLFVGGLLYMGGFIAQPGAILLLANPYPCS